MSICTSPLNFSNPETQIIDAEISEPLHKGAIVHTAREPNDYVLGSFTRTKKGVNCRVILNPKRFNEFLKFDHCKLEFIEDVPVY